MRYLPLALLALVVVGCGSSSAAPAPTATSTPGRSTAKKFSAPPKMTINKNGNYNARVVTTDGEFTIHLLPQAAPIAVNSFVFLGQHHFFDGITFHRIVEGFMIQGGDPTGTGTGGPGYSLPIEPTRGRFKVGTVALAHSSAPHSNGSQFFIVVGSQGTALPRQYTIFGQVTQGMNVVQKIARTPVGPNQALGGEMSSPLKTVSIKTLRIVQG